MAFDPKFLAKGSRRQDQRLLSPTTCHRLHRSHDDDGTTNARPRSFRFRALYPRSRLPDRCSIIVWKGIFKRSESTRSYDRLLKINKESTGHLEMKTKLYINQMRTTDRVASTERTRSGPPEREATARHPHVVQECGLGLSVFKVTVRLRSRRKLTERVEQDDSRLNLDRVA